MADIDADFCQKLGFASWGEDLLEVPSVESMTVAVGDSALELLVGGHSWLRSGNAEPGNTSAWLAVFNGCCLLGLVFPDSNGDSAPTFTRFVTGLSTGSALIGKVDVIVRP